MTTVRFSNLLQFHSQHSAQQKCSQNQRAGKAPVTERDIRRVCDCVSHRAEGQLAGDSNK